MARRDGPGQSSEQPRFALRTSAGIESLPWATSCAQVQRSLASQATGSTAAPRKIRGRVSDLPTPCNHVRLLCGPKDGCLG